MNEIKYKISYTGNYSNQFKCHQNFTRLLLLSTSTTTQIHKFTQKFEFKGPQDGISKLIKNLFDKFECELTRVANAFDCFYHIKTELTKNDSNSTKQEHYINTRSNLITKKKTQILDYTFICFGFNNQTEYEAVT